MNNKPIFNHIQNYSVSEVFNNAWTGFVFEFFSSKDLNFIIEDLIKITGKAVTVTNDPKILPTWTTAVLVREYEGKSPLYKFSLAPQNYPSISPIVTPLLEWIKTSAKTNTTTGIGVSLSFNNGSLKTVTSISNMDVAKMILKIDEEYLYSRFPDRKESPFCLSIKKLMPFNEFLNTSNPFRNLNTSFKMPNTTYYGLDLTEKSYGVLNFNYIGGKGYEEKPLQVEESIKYFIINTYQVLNISEYTKEMEYEMTKILEGYSKFRRCYYDPEFFLAEYKDIQVGVDLKTVDQIIKTFWPKLRDPLVRLMMESGLKKGKFNLDMELGTYQLKDAVLKKADIKGLQIMNCEVQGLMEGCEVWNSKITNSRILDSTLIDGNKLDGCFLESTRADRNNTINKSTISNNGEIINCKVTESVIKNAGIGKEARLDESSIVIGKPIETSKKSEELKVSEPKDYIWFKNLLGDNPDKNGYGNEYKIKW